jgi:simple sugar transport system substrate-binding protein
MSKSQGFSRRQLLQASAAVAAGPMWLASRSALAAQPTVGFVYVGPKNDFGYNQSHAEAMAKLRKDKPGIRILEEEKVPETAAVEKTMESMINLDGANLLFLTSFGYFDPFMLRVAAKYPEVQFRHQGLLWNPAKNPPNTGSYFGYISEAIYACGVAAAKVSKTRKLGFIAAKPIPAVLRSVNSFLLGARSVDPSLTVKVIFTGDWSVPTKEAEATNALADAGVDCVNCHIDDLKVVLGVAEQRSMFSFGLNTDQSALAPKGYVTGALYAWDKMYGTFIDDLVAKKPLPNLLQGGFAEGFVKMGPFGRSATPEVQAAVSQAASELASGQRAVFTGPLKDNKGNTVVAAGQKMAVTDASLGKMNYLVDGVIGSLA